MTIGRFLGCLLSTAVLLGPSAARAATSALPPPPPPEPWSSDDGGRTVDPRWSIAPMLGYSGNGLNAGLGVRAGKTLANRVYLGGAFVYNIGESLTYYPYAGYPYYGTSYAGISSSVSSSLFYTGPEGGYDFDLKYVVLRAYMGLGIVHISVSYNTSATGPAAAVAGSTSATGFGLWPGAAVLYDIPRSSFFVGGDLRLLISTGGATGQGISHDPAVGLFAFGGMKLGS
jgi:hypothetical protein